MSRGQFFTGRSVEQIMTYFLLLFEPLHNLSSSTVNQTHCITTTSCYNTCVFSCGHTTQHLDELQLYCYKLHYKTITSHKHLNFTKNWKTREQYNIVN